MIEIDATKTVPYVSISHSFVERLLGTTCREYLDHVLFWNSVDLERKLEEFRKYYNHHHIHASLNGNTPAEANGYIMRKQTKLQEFRWKTYCQDLVELPLAA